MPKADEFQREMWIIHGLFQKFITQDEARKLSHVIKDAAREEQRIAEERGRCA